MGGAKRKKSWSQEGKCGIWRFLEVNGEARGRGVVGGGWSVAGGHTYRFQPLHRLLADVHASGLLHLHVTQVLQADRQTDTHTYRQGETPRLPQARLDSMKVPTRRAKA